jgi:Raf kinase inhibitor-like YbhB/YbcL family protein
MREVIVALILSLAALSLSATPGLAQTDTSGSMQLTSTSFNDGDYLPLDHILSADFGFGCSGGNKSPELSWSGAPDGTKSFALTVFDPDAPTGSGFWHWVVVNIPPTVTELPMDAGNPRSGLMPQGAREIRTDFGTPGYGGPCPPLGDHPHRYFFTVYAVNTNLQVDSTTTAALVGFMLHFDALDKGVLEGFYKLT